MKKDAFRNSGTFKHTKNKILMGEIKKIQTAKEKISRKHLIIGVISIATTLL